MTIYFCGDRYVRFKGAWVVVLFRDPVLLGAVLSAPNTFFSAEDFSPVSTINKAIYIIQNDKLYIYFIENNCRCRTLQNLLKYHVFSFFLFFTYFHPPHLNSLQKSTVVWIKLQPHPEGRNWFIIKRPYGRRPGPLLCQTSSPYFPECRGPEAGLRGVCVPPVNGCRGDSSETVVGWAARKETCRTH